MDLELFAVLPPGREFATWEALDEEERRLLTVLSRYPGRESAIHVDDLAALCRLSPRRMQAVAKGLVERHRIRIGKGVSDGYFIITTPEEGQASAFNHLRRALSNLDAYRALMGITDAQFEEALDQIRGQLRLFSAEDRSPKCPL